MTTTTVPPARGAGNDRERPSILDTYCRRHGYDPAHVRAAIAARAADDRLRYQRAICGRPVAPTPIIVRVDLGTFFDERVADAFEAFLDGRRADG